MNVYQVDAFTNTLFKGNPAAVCPLQEWISEALMQKIAAENNLAETAFYVFNNGVYEIRWFTPTVEVPLCGHATLAAAHVLYSHEGCREEKISFSSKSGILEVTKNGSFYTLLFPAYLVTEQKIAPELIQAGISPIAYYVQANYGIAVMESEEEVLLCAPDFAKLKLLKEDIVVVTAKGEKWDFVSRSFGPKVGVDEDPVTGSSHTRLIPFWASQLGKNYLEAFQLSSRGGFLVCENLGSHVKMSGEAVTYLIGEIKI